MTDANLAAVRAFVASLRPTYLVEDEFDRAVLARAAGNLSAYFSAIRCVHFLNATNVAAGEYDPHLVKWHRIFSPIEEDAWNVILECRLEMFPQYPVGRFFVDFGDPWTKNAIECDGKAFHNAKRDAWRDNELRRLGWSVLRIPGKSLVLGEEHPESGDAIIRREFGLPAKRFDPEGERLDGVWGGA